MTKKWVPHAGKLTLLAACAMLAACGGGGEGANAGGRQQFITFKYPGGGELEQVKTLSATTTSGLAVSFKSSTPDFCTVSGDQLTLVKAGECRVIASQAGGKTDDGVQWAAADDADQLFTVLKHPQMPTVPLAVMVRASSANVELSATTSAGIAATYTSTTPTVCTVSGKTLTASGAGLCMLAVTAPANDHYAALEGGVAAIAVGPIPPMVVQRQNKTQTIALAAVDASGSALTYSSTAPAVCSVSGTSLQLTADGLCTLSMSGANGASETLTVNVGPRFFASGFNATTSRTAELGGIDSNGGFPDASWCGAVTPSYCNLSVTPFSATFSFDIKPSNNPNWKGDFGWSYYTFEIGAPMKQNGSTFEALPFDVKTEESLFVTLNMNQTLFDGKGGVFVRVKTNHLLKKSDGSDCYVTVSTHVLPTSAAPAGYVLPFKDFAVTDKCESADLPQTEGWMFDWGVSAESKAAALKEIRTYGIRALQFAPNGLNTTRPTPNADGSVPTDPKDAAYTLSTGITVFGPITVQ
ncbi:hypothetical protein J2X16_001614 [Pelomonas aquatica]|uniref:Uncharacterized protein n=1 Tax=Pelomonas aquatica TaxID=431058 RepID=A0ABU1Z6N7_9BURK|nr:hypothetical protein [Pelomonas aquatica]MDR7296275.1 hypothetical protein [Pelomonas aquatica]